MLKRRKIGLELRNEGMKTAPPIALEHLIDQFALTLAGNWPARDAHVARIKNVSVYDERRDELEKHEFMMGVPRGRLAVTLDVLTDALVLVGQHGVYCQSARQLGKPAMDIQLITKSITDAKDLISGVMAELKNR